MIRTNQSLVHSKNIYSALLCVWTSAWWKLSEVSKGGFLKPEEVWTPADGAKGAGNTQATSLTFTLASHRFLCITHSPWPEWWVWWESGDLGFWSWY